MEKLKPCLFTEHRSHHLGGTKAGRQAGRQAGKAPAGGDKRDRRNVRPAASGGGLREGQPEEGNVLAGMEKLRKVRAGGDWSLPGRGKSQGKVWKEPRRERRPARREGLGGGTHHQIGRAHV